MAYMLNDFEALKVFLETPGLVIVDFFATWCPPCKALAPILEQVESVPVAKINTDDNTDAASEYRISALPTLVFFKDGQEVHRMLGLQSKAALDQKIQELS